MPSSPDLNRIPGMAPASGARSRPDPGAPADPPAPAAAASTGPFARLRPDNAWARLGAPLGLPVSPTPLPAPRLVAVSESAAVALGIDPAGLGRPEALAVLAGAAGLPGGLALATPWGGHRDRAWAGRLGDLRAFLLADGVDAAGRPWALQLEGAGPTPFAGDGDGRLSLAAALREMLFTEALAGLGIPTIRALAVAASDAPGSDVDGSPAATLLRLAPGFVRFGHFEHLYYCGRHDALRVLADHVIRTWFPELRDAPHPYAGLLREVGLRTARLVAAWQAAGFCHGAIDTSTLSVLGLTMAAPSASFLEAYDADHTGAGKAAGPQAYAAQPAAAEWCCYRFGQAMLPLVGSIDQAQAALAPFRRSFGDELERLLRLRLGLAQARERDRALLDGLFAMLHRQHIDFPGFFQALAQVRSDDASGDHACRALCVEPAAFDAWVERYRARLREEGRDDRLRAAQMLQANPREALREARIEDAVRAEVDRRGGNPGEGPGTLGRLLRALARPFDGPATAAAQPD